MIKVRNLQYGAGYSVADQIKQALHGLSNTTIGTTRYVGIWMMGDINPLGCDESNRPIFSINFRLHRTITT